MYEYDRDVQDCVYIAKIGDITSTLSTLYSIPRVIVPATLNLLIIPLSTSKMTFVNNPSPLDVLQAYHHYVLYAINPTFKITFN